MNGKLSLGLLVGLASLLVVADQKPSSAACFQDAPGVNVSCDIVNSNSGTLITYAGFLDAGFIRGNVLNITFNLDNELADNDPYVVSKIEFTRDNWVTKYDYPAASPGNSITLTSTDPAVFSPAPVPAIQNPPSLPFIIDLRDQAYGGTGATAPNPNDDTKNVIGSNFQIRAYLPQMSNRTFANADVLAGSSADYLGLIASTYRYPITNACRYPTVCTAANNSMNQQTRNVDMIVPGPLPIFGASVGFAFSRRLRRRIALARS
jgi:hypothetical protein